MLREELDQKYIEQANQLEGEFFGIVDEGLPNQHRVLKAGKLIDEFNQRHSKIWHNHEAGLITGGFIIARVPPEPSRDLLAEIDELKSRLATLEK